MRAFWAVVGIVMLALAGYLLINRSGSEESAPSAPRTDRAERAARQASQPQASRPAEPDTLHMRAPAAAPQAVTQQAAPQRDVSTQVLPPEPVRSVETAEAPANELRHPVEQHISPDAPTPAAAEGDPGIPEAPSSATVDAGLPATGQELSPIAIEAQALLREWQTAQGDPSWSRVLRLWMGDVHAEVDRIWDDSREPSNLARAAVGSESIWRTAFLDMAREEIAERMREQGIDGEALLERQMAIVGGIEEAIASNVTSSISVRRERSAAKPVEVPVEGGPAGTPASGNVVAQEDGEPVEGKEWLVQREDGSMVADGRYLIRGRGTIEDPYKISWEHLISAEEAYVPREGRTEIPRRIQMLHDKHVEITGYVAFPLLMDAADELLVMLNQWDGCCLGVPPTPYDAVEVILKDPVTGNARMASYGVVSGTFKVEPHLVGGWLVGLYLMEDARLKPLAYGGFAP